jgi:predicted ATPase/signal transduction histidine kinase
MTGSVLSVGSEVLWQDTERALCRLSRTSDAGDRHAFIPVLSGGEHPTLESINRLTHEFGLKDHLDSSWAVRPVELVREQGRTMLLVEYAGGQPLDRLISGPMDIDRFLPLAVSMSGALSRLHGRGVIHKDIKPANVLVDATAGKVWLTGFGIASRLPRERQPPEPPEFIAGTLAYMAPEQTGRVNRSIDSRSDLYSLGVTFYEMLTGTLPFIAADPMELVHCHIAKQPLAPSDRSIGVPRSLSAITMKLLAKTAEERYQTAAGVETDLRRCLAEWQAHGRIEDFVPAVNDTPDRLRIPERLYGRDREIDTLLAAFERIVAGGHPEMVLVSGYSGIGKSAVVNELHKPLVPPRGLFASGKFDQYKRDIPYATLAQAFQGLIKPLLTKNEDELRKWRDALREALDPNGLLMIELVPELKHIIGEQPPVPELPPQEAQGRFQLVFRRFISVFARPEHPLALFLDDLQWLDAATLDLIEDLLTRTDLQHLLLIGAYRDNEVSPTHALIRKLDAIRQGGGKLQDIVLTPLTRDDLAQLLSDSLRCALERAEPLAQMIHEKTTGNPFFAIQFISTLADEGLLTFDYGAGRWTWELNRIHAQGYTDNVVELMVAKLNRLPVDTQGALKQFACMGNTAVFEMLAMAYDQAVEVLHEHLWEAVRAGLIFRSEDSYRFLHDRVQESAYTLIPQELRAAAHLRIGMLLAEHTPAAKREEAIFEIVNQLNRGAHLLTSAAERERVAELNLIAGRRAKVSTAYASALKYLWAGRDLLTDETWTSNYRLIFSMEYLMAECELQTADKVAAENRLSQLPGRANNRHDFCLATRLRLTLYTTLDRCDRAVDVFLEWLRREGTVWSNRPTREDVLREYERIWTLLGNRQIEDLMDLPLITDPEVLDTLDVFTEIVTPSILFDEHFSTLVVCRLVTLSLEHGNSDAAPFAYVWLAMFAGPRLGNYKDGFRFGQLGYDLVEKRGMLRYQARTYMSIGAMVIPWVEHIANGRELTRRAFDLAYRIGDLTFASYSWDQLITICLGVGDPLGEVQTECENGLTFAKRVRFGLVIHLCGSQLGLIRTLRGLNQTLGSLDHDDYSEPEVEHNLASNPNLVFAEFYYWTRKVEARVFAGDFAAAANGAFKGQRLYWTSAAMFETAEFRLYAALAHAGAWNLAPPNEKPRHFEALSAHHQQLEIWAEYSQPTFESRAALVAAEIARIEDRAVDAQRLYERAIRSAHANGFVHIEAIANELAASFYMARDLEKIANVYLRDARYCYLRWGADGKVRQLEQRHPHLLADKAVADSTTTIMTAVEHLDLSTVLKVSEALSGEIVLETLIDTLMRTAIEHAGAERGLLILPRGEEFWIEAEATTRSNDVHVEVSQRAITEASLPLSAFRYAQRTREPVLLQDASEQSAFSEDPYISQRRARAVLCLPILKQSRVIGMLYLENNLTAHVFTPTRMTVLKLLASEAAISMENARLYRERKDAADALRTLQMELAHANRLATMGQLAASIAHEINQPIGAARNNAHAALRFLVREPPDLGEVKEALEGVVNDTYRASDIISGIRDQVKKLPPRMDRVDLNDAIVEVIALIRGELSKHRVGVQLRLAENLPPSRADRVQLQQVILNLILNAIEAMVGSETDARELVISAVSSGADGLLVAIADSGPGIAAEDRERIFDSFYTTKAGGVGIGLSICRSIIDAHGGRLWADAHQPRGAALKFTLPVDF